MASIKRFIYLIVLVSCLAFPISASAQASYSLRIVYSDVTEGDKALTLGIYFTVFDDNAGQVVAAPQIQAAEITQLDTGIRSVAAVKKADNPFYIALLLDASGSMSSSANDLRAAAKSALSNAPKGAQFAVFQFSNQIQLLRDFTDNIAALQQAIDKVNPVGSAGTCLYDSIYTAVDTLSKMPAGRRALIVFTDGKDETSQGGVCSTHSYDEVVEFANQKKTHVPINTIGLAGAASGLNATELTNMASTTGGYSAIGSRSNLGDMFKKIMTALGSQYVASVDLFPTKGQHDAVLKLILKDGTSLTGTSSFESSKDYFVPLAPVSVSENSVTYNQDTNKYEISLAIVSPQLIKQLVVQVWDEQGGTKVDEISTEGLTSPASIEYDPKNLTPKGSYSFRIIATGTDDIPITTAKADNVLILHKFKYDPTILVPEMAIASVAINGAELQVSLTVKNEQELSGYDGWLIDETTKAQVAGSAFTQSAPAPNGTLTIPMTGIPGGQYTVVVRALDKNNQPVADGNYSGIVFIPPKGPSWMSKLIVGLKAAPWIIGTIVGILALAILLLGILLLLSRRETGTPVLRRQLETNLKKSDRSPLSNTMVGIESQTIDRDAARRAPRSAPSKPSTPSAQDSPATIVGGPPLAPIRPQAPVLRVRQSPDPSIQGQVIAINLVPFLMGRQDCSLNISGDHKISRRHAQISFDQTQRRYIITDLGSVNGLWVNGVRIAANQSAPLAPGTVIDLGPDTRLTFEVG